MQFQGHLTDGGRVPYHHMRSQALGRKRTQAFEPDSGIFATHLRLPSSCLAPRRSFPGDGDWDRIRNGSGFERVGYRRKRDTHLGEQGELVDLPGLPEALLLKSLHLGLQALIFHAKLRHFLNGRGRKKENGNHESATLMRQESRCNLPSRFKHNTATCT